MSETEFKSVKVIASTRRQLKQIAAKLDKSQYEVLQRLVEDEYNEVFPITNGKPIRNRRNKVGGL